MGGGWGEDGAIYCLAPPRPFPTAGHVGSLTQRQALAKSNKLLQQQQEVGVNRELLSSGHVWLLIRRLFSAATTCAVAMFGC